MTSIKAPLSMMKNLTKHFHTTFIILKMSIGMEEIEDGTYMLYVQSFVNGISECLAS